MLTPPAVAVLGVHPYGGGRRRLMPSSTPMNPAGRPQGFLSRAIARVLLLAHLGLRVEDDGKFHSSEQELRNQSRYIV